MDTQLLSGLGLEPVLTTSQLADYLGVNVHAIYDLRTDGRGPSGFRVGREIPALPDEIGVSQPERLETPWVARHRSGRLRSADRAEPRDRRAIVRSATSTGIVIATGSASRP